MMTTGNTGNLRRKEVMKKPIKKKMKIRDPYAEGIDPSAGRGVPLSAYTTKPKPQVVNRAGKGNKLPIKKKKGK